MKHTRIDLDLATADTDGLADGLTGAGPWAASDFVATAPSDELAHQISLTSGDNLSAITITITGTDADGKPQTEDIIGPNAATVEGSKYFATISGVAASATLGANTLDVGWPDEAVSQTIPIGEASIAPVVSVEQTGTANWDIQVTNDDIYKTDDPAPFAITDQEDIFWVADSGLTGETASAMDSLAIPGVSAVRVKVNSYNAGAELQVYISQATRI